MSFGLFHFYRFLLKLFEKLLESKMTNFINKNNILSPSQYGFRSNSSTELAITTFYDQLLTNLNNNKLTCSIFLDLRKAFDSVNHEILLKKLAHYGFCGPIHNFLRTYLSGRKICSKIGNQVSKFNLIEYGVPQGSILGPLLFLLFVNDLPNATKFRTTLFADDTNLHISHYNLKTLQIKVSEEIDKINNWINLNRLSINYKKSCYMIVGKINAKTSDFKITINLNLIELTNHVKYLGVYLDYQLTWKIHIEKLCKKTL